MRKVKLQQAHELMMDELCNGEERRRKQREEDEYERTMMAQQASMGARLRATIAPALDRIDQQTYFGGAGGGIDYNTTAVTTVKGYDSLTDTYDLGNGIKMTKAQVEDNPGLVANLKKALGL